MSRLRSGLLLTMLLAGVLAALLGVGAQLLPVVAGTDSSAAAPDGGRQSAQVSSRDGALGTERSDRPNIVFVLTDDLSTDLMPYLPAVADLQRRGLSFSRYFVTNSLCCPSRASILTGGYPHTNGVRTNGGPDGGHSEFVHLGDDHQTFATSLDDAGYTTALMGKYLNGYFASPPRSTPLASVPPGWDEWYVAGGHDGYSGFDYTLNENGRLVRYGDDEADYATDVLADKAVDFVHRTAGTGAPFLLEVSTFSPHYPYTPAPRHADAHPGLTYPRTSAFDTPPEAPPPWLAGRAALPQRALTRIDTTFRLRAQAVMSVDELVADLVDALETEGILDDTYIVFSSDNGFHMGEHGLRPGKMTAFDTDIRVPLIVAGPGVPQGVTSDAMVANIDLCPTFVELGGGEQPALVDGRSLVPLWHGRAPSEWRQAVLIEQLRVETAAEAGPDRQAWAEMPPTYDAIRLPDAVYVEYADGGREYYDIAHDPDQLRNLAPALTEFHQAALSDALAALVDCRGPDECWAASMVRSDRVSPN